MSSCTLSMGTSVSSISLKLLPTANQKINTNRGSTKTRRTQREMRLIIVFILSMSVNCFGQTRITYELLDLSTNAVNGVSQITVGPQNNYSLLRRKGSGRKESHKENIFSLRFVFVLLCRNTANR